MNFNDMHATAKRIDAQVKSLEDKLANPVNMMYSHSSQGVKVLSMLKDMIEDVDTKKKDIERVLQEENSSWSGMVEDYNNVDKFKSEIVDTLNKYENIWASNCPDYKPFISYPHGSSVNDELDSSLNNLIIEDKRQIEDQSFNDSLNITMSK